MADYLLDTNHASSLMARTPAITDRIRQRTAAGDRFGLPIVVVGEPYFAAYASQRQQENLHRLETLRQALIGWPFNEQAAAMFGRIQAEQRRKGKPIPPIDAQIAAIARCHGLTLLTADAHFDLVDDLQVENWLR